MKYYKIQFGYNNADYLSIDQNELATAIALFIQGNGRGVFKNGVCRGQDIIRIIPDWHKIKGWNPTWKMESDDYEDVSSLQLPYQTFYEKVKNLVEFAVKENRPELLKGNVEEKLKELPTSRTSDFSKQLADKFTI